MWRVFKFSYERAPLLAAALLVLTLLLGQRATQVRLEVSPEELMPRKNPLRAEYERARERFGSDKVAAVYLRDPALFTPRVLARLRELGEHLAKLDSVQRVEGLFTVNQVRGEAGTIETGPLFADIPDDPAEMAIRVEAALDNPLLRRNVVSPDGRSTLLTLLLEPGEGGDGAGHDLAAERELYQRIEAILRGNARLNLNLETDGGALVYLNGREVARVNLPPGRISRTTPPATAGGGRRKYTFALDPGRLVDGANLVAVELHRSERERESESESESERDSESENGTEGEIDGRGYFDLSLTVTVRGETATPVGLGSGWRVLADGSRQRTAWRRGTYEDSGWEAGMAPRPLAGAGGDGTAPVTVYLRHGFDLGEIGRLPGVRPEDHGQLYRGYQGVFAEMFQVGAPALRVDMADAVVADQAILLPLSALLIVTLIGVCLRSFHAAAVPVVNSVFSVVWTLGLMALADVPVNLLNYIVPALIFVVGATEDVHLMAAFDRGRRKGLSRRVALVHTGRELGLTVALTAVTTVIGFAAAGAADIPALQHFGAAAAIGMATRFLASALVLPVYVRLVVRELPAPAERGGGGSPAGVAAAAAGPAGEEGEFSSRAAAAIMARLRRPRAVAAVFFAAALPFLFLARDIRLSNDLLGFLPPDAPQVVRSKAVSRDLAGTKLIYVVLKGNPGDFKRAANLARVHEVAEYLRGFPEFDSVISLAEPLRLVNQAMHGGDPAFRTTPEKDDLLAQYLLFFRRDDLSRYVTADYGQANLVVRTGITDSTRLNALVAEVRAGLDSGRFGQLSHAVTGEAVLVAAAVDQVARGQALSLGAVTGLLFLVVAVLFVSVRCGVLAVLANLFSIGVVFGLMGLTGIPLNIGTCMVAAITVGIGVDDTLHLMVRYNREVKGLKDEGRAIEQTLRGELVPVLVTSAGLAGGFLILCASSFVPVQQFGALSALVIVLAVLADLVLTPALLATTRLVTLWDLLDIKLKEALMASSTLFRGMTSWQVKKLILLTQLEDYPAGARVITEGEWGDQLFIVIDGELEVSKANPDGGRTTIAQLGVGEAFGEIALVSRSRRSADVTAATDARVLAVDWDSLQKLRRFSPYLASRFYLNLSRILGDRLARSLESRGS